LLVKVGDAPPQGICGHLGGQRTGLEGPIEEAGYVGTGTLELVQPIVECASVRVHEHLGRKVD